MTDRSTRLRCVAVVVLASALGSACTDAPRDPRADSGNIFTAAAGVYGGGYDSFLERKRTELEGSVRRERQLAADKLVLPSGMSESEAKRTVLDREVRGLNREVAAAEAAAASSQAQSAEEREKKVELERRMARLDTEADRIVAAASSSPKGASDLEERLTKVRAEQRLLIREFESLSEQ